jgi:hypothetical protein
MAVPSQPVYAFDVGEVYGLAPTVAASPPTDHSPALGRIAMSHTNGRAGWWKSPCPDLARGRGGQPPGLLYKALWRPRRLRPPPPPPPAAAAPPARPGARRSAVWTGRAGWDRVGPSGVPWGDGGGTGGGLTGLPPALVIVDENDVLRDDGGSLRPPPDPSRRADHERALQRDPARLHDAESASRDRGHDGRDRAGDPNAAQSARDGRVTTAILR